MINRNLDIEYYFNIRDRDKLIEESILDLPYRVYENRDQLRILYSSDVKGYWYDFLIDKYSDLIREVIFKDYKNKLIPKKVVCIAYINTLISLIGDWIIQPIPVSPAIFRGYLLQFLRSSPKELIYGS